MQTPLACGHTVFNDRCTHCRALQTRWYLTLANDGFEDAENTAILSRPLKAWTGLSIRITSHDSEESIDVIDLIISQEPQGPLQSAFPESHLSAAEQLLNHPDFDRLCERICSHGNHRLVPGNIRSIWVHYIDGLSNRAIASLLGFNDTGVWRVINTLTQWMQLMDLDETEETNLARVVLRDFKPKQDEAFIYASWRNALWYDNDERKEGEADRFFRQATDTIRNILQNPKVQVRIACLSDSPDFIVGYSVITGNCLHFIYVKVDYRGKRIGTLLMPRSVDQVSPIMTKIGRTIAIKKKFIKENRDGQTEGK